MTIENELRPMYDGEAESLKVNLEDLKRYKEAQKVKQDKRFKKKAHARSVAKSQGFKLGRWTGTYARIKSGDEKGSFFNSHLLEVHTSRPGKGSAPQSHEKSLP
jgi:hypothetical protein